MSDAEHAPHADGAAGHDEPDQFLRTRLTQIGEAPDARFTFANERTFLAWNRTALGTMVAGLAMLQLLKDNNDQVATKIAGIGLMLMAAVVSLASYRHWYRSEVALRLRRDLPHSWVMPALALVVGFAAVVAAFSSW